MKTNEAKGQTPHQNHQTAGLYRLPTILKLSGRSRSSIYRDIEAGLFPRPVRIGKRSIAWRRDDVHEWLDNLETIDRRQQ